MSNLIIANRYAKALFVLSLELNVLEKVKDDMNLIINTCKDSKEFVTFLKSPIIRTDKKLIILKKLFENRIAEISLKYILIITRKNREGYLASIARSYIDLYKKYKNILTVYLDTAIEIDEKTRKKMIALLHKQTNCDIELLEDVKKELIGGFVLRYADYQYDASIIHQLNLLQREATQINLYERKF